MRKNAFYLASFLAICALLGAALPAYAKNNSCSFQAHGLSMSFGLLDPSINSDPPLASVPGVMSGDCAGVTISVDNGRNYILSRNLKNSAGDLISYDLGQLGQLGQGKGKDVTFDLLGTILWSAYANASAGMYTDTVIISVTP